MNPFKALSSIDKKIDNLQAESNEIKRLLTEDYRIEQEYIYREFNTLINTAKEVAILRQEIIDTVQRHLVNHINYTHSLYVLSHRDKGITMHDIWECFIKWMDENFRKELNKSIVLTAYSSTKQSDTEHYLTIIRREFSNEKRTVFNINEYPIIPSTWKGYRIITNLIMIGNKNSQNENEKAPLDGSNDNIVNILIRPLNICLSINGNHSQLSGIIQKSGTSSYSQIIDITPAYGFIKFDGLFFKPIDNNEKDNQDPYIATKSQFPDYDDYPFYHADKPEDKRHFYNLIRHLGMLFELARIAIESPINNKNISEENE